MRYVRYPNQEEWNDIFNRSPFKDFNFSSLDFADKNFEITDVFDTPILNSNGFLLIQRVRALIESYILLSFYYELGIPDEIEQRNNKDIFNDFEEHHYQIKARFDNCTDVFYFKIFSCWETLGHILNIQYDLKTKRVYFRDVVSSLEKIDANMYFELNEIINDTEFKNAINYRNQITHNQSPNIPGLVRTRFKNGLETEKFQECLSPNNVIKNINFIIELLKRSIFIIGK
nr:Cthe_2314 family HEPN domain-containing protein [Paenibacillus sp. SZ31]